MTQQRTALDFEAMRRAIESSDAEGLIGFYADDAEVRTINRNTTPSQPMVLRGEEVAEFIRTVYGRDMTHRVENEVVGGDRLAFNEVCEYPDGTRVLAASTVELKGGKIQRQTNVEAWDE